MSALRLNPRVFLAADAAAVAAELRGLGIPLPGAAGGTPGRLLPLPAMGLALENLEPPETAVLRRTAQEAGATFLGGPQNRPAPGLLLGPREALRAVADELRETGDLGPAIAKALEHYDRRRFTIRMGPRRLQVGPRPAVMAVLNVTPDSFSDGGRYLRPAEAVARAEELVAQGADLIDIGGESTRPGAEPVPEDEELRRVLPVVETLAERLDVPLSIDTRHARVAREAVAAGACLVNDVSGLQGDPEMPAAVAESGAACVVMHMRGEPRTMQHNPTYGHLMAEVCRHLRRGLQAAVEAGVPEDAVIVDPGIGFGKTLEHNLKILARLDQLRTLGAPVLVGPSRKRFIGDLAGEPEPTRRVPGTAAACALAVAAGALMVRVHDVAEAVQALAVAAAVRQAAEQDQP